MGGAVDSEGSARDHYEAATGEITCKGVREVDCLLVCAPRPDDRHRAAEVGKRAQDPNPRRPAGKVEQACGVALIVEADLDDVIEQIAQRHRALSTLSSRRCACVSSFGTAAGLKPAQAPLSLMPSEAPRRTAAWHSRGPLPAERPQHAFMWLAASGA